MITVVKVLGRAHRANVDGETVERMEDIFVPSEPGVFKQMDTHNHFCYRRGKGKNGATLMCSCGFYAGIFNYEAYRKYYDHPRGRLLCCVHLIQYGTHADGSTE